MPAINNFDQSSSGIDLDLYIMRDEEQARENFDDLLTKIEDTPHKKYDFYAVNVLEFNPFSFIDPTEYEFTRAELNTAIREEKGLAEDIAAILGGSPFTSRYTKAQVFEAMREAMPAGDLAAFMVDKFKPLFEVITCRGYCQGDLVAVVYSRADVAHLVSADGKPWSETWQGRRDFCTNVIFDQPIWGSFKIVAGAYECEFMIDQCLENTYEYDRDQILAGFNQASDCPPEVGAAAYQFLADNLPKFI